MRRRTLRTLLGAAAAALVLGTAVPGALPVGAQTAPGGSTGAPETPSGDPAIDDLVGCVQGSRRLLVLMLIDESASLKQTDPQNRRVDAARGALDSLIALATTEGSSSPEVQVALAAFSNEYRPVRDWTVAGDDTAAALNDSLDEFARFHDGIDTDFVNALSAGREALADKSAEITTAGGGAPCRAVLLFTDGGFDIAVRTSEADQERLGTTKPYAPGLELTSRASVQKAEAAGRKELCRPGGLADQLRNDDVTLLTVALSGDVARRAQLPLAAATTGKADGYTCGTETERTHGAYLPAEGVDVLVTRFNEVGTRLAGGNLLPGANTVKVCGDDSCDEGTRKFLLDKSLRRAQILALPPKAGAVLELDGPGGDPVRITKAGRTDVGGVTVVAREVSGRGLTLDLERPKDLAAWKGEWSVALLDPKGNQKGDEATLQVYVFSDISVSLGKTEALVRGKPSKVTASLNVPKGVKAEDVVATATAEARFRNPITGAVDTVPLTGPPVGPFTGTYTPPADATANALVASVEVRMTTTSRAALVSQSAPAELLLKRPGGAIQFAPASLKLPSLTGTGTTETTMFLVGGDKPGCVWFGKVDVPDAPEGAGELEVTVDGKPMPREANCIKVPAGKSLTILVEAKVPGRASGTVRGTLAVYERTEGATKASTTLVPFRFDLARGVDQARRLVLALLLLVVGLGVPMLALLIINAITARFQTLDAVRGASLPVLVSGRSVQRTDAGYPRTFLLKVEDFGSLAAAGHHRRFTFGGVVFRAKASRNPFSATIAMAAPEGGAEKLKGNEGSRVELDPALAGSWIFLLDADKTRRLPRGDAAGQLIAFVAEGDINTQTNRMVPDITDRLPQIADRLAGLVRQTKRKSPPKKKAAAASSAPEAEADAEDGPTVVDEAEVGELDNALAVEGAPGATDADAAEQAEAPAEPAEPAEPLAPAPTGFGGRAHLDPPAAAPAPSEPADADDDDGPEAPPLGFSGGARPSS